MNIQETFKQIYILYKFYQRNLFQGNEQIEFKRIIKNIRINGFHVIENYYSASECDEIINDLDNMIENKKDCFKYEDYCNDRRLFGADRFSDRIKCFKNDKYLNAICNYFLDESAQSFCTLGAKIEYNKSDFGSGGDWHRDSVFPDQFKAMLYLSDVSKKNGPFEYLTSSNKWVSLIDGTLNCGTKGNQYRLDNELIESRFLSKKKYNKVTFTAKKGTLILFNSFGIHRGTPLKESSRYAITNYYYTNKHLESDSARLSKKFKLPDDYFTYEEGLCNSRDRKYS